MLWDIITYPLILLALFRGAFLTYQTLSKKSDDQKDQLEYWVVISALLFLFPKLDYILSFFMFSGLVGFAKFLLLAIVVVSKSKGYGFVYKLIEEQFIGNIQPYIKNWLKKSEGWRQDVAGTLVLSVASGYRNVNRLLLSGCADQHLYYLNKAVNKTLKDIQKEQAIREKNKSERPSLSVNTGDKSGAAATSILGLLKDANPTDKSDDRS